MKYLSVFLFGVGASLLWPATAVQQPKDAVSEAFDKYERMYREAALITAERLESGELDTEQESRDFRADANTHARKTAFTDIAKAEAALLQGRWTAEVEAEILRGYSR